MLIPSRLCAEAESTADTNETSGLLLNKDIGDINTPNPTELYFRMIVACVMVCVLAVVAIAVSRKVLPKLTNLQGKQIKVVETVHLGSRKAVHLIEVDNKRILIGSSSEHITKISDLTKSFSEQLEQEITKE